MDRSATEKIFRRVLKGGRMHRLPKSRKDTLVFLAVAAAVLDPRRVHSEADVNEQLQTWLVGFADVDHVTVRRYLVDHSMLLRDAAGSTYRANQAVIGNVIDADVRSLLPGDILAELERERADRRSARGSGRLAPSAES